MAEIKITDQPTIEQYTASAGATTFSFHFPIYEATDLKVNYQPVGTVVDDTATLLTINTDYVISGVGSEGGGTVVLKFGAEANALVTLRRERPFARTLNINSGGTFSVDDINHDFNSELMVAQQLKTKNEMRQLSYQESEVIPEADVKLPKLAAKQFWRKPPSGVGLEALTYDPTETIDAALLRAELASHGFGQGAAMVGTFGSGTVQSTVDDYVAFKNDIADTAAGKGASMVGVEGGTNVQDFIDAHTSVAIIPGIISGMIVSQNSGDTLHDIDIAAGLCTATDGVANVYLVNSTTFTKQIDANWALGSGNGGFPSGLTLTSGTWYHLFAIGKSDGTFDAGFDTDLTATNLLADASGFTTYKRIMSVYYTTISATDQILPFIMNPSGKVQWKSDSIQDHSGVVSVASRDLITLTVPPDIKIEANILIQSTGAQTMSLYASDPDTDDVAAYTNNAQFQVGSASVNINGASSCTVSTNTSSQIGVRRQVGVGATSYNISTYGWNEKRI